MHSLLSQARNKWLQLTLDRDIGTLPVVAGALTVHKANARRLDICYDKQHAGAGQIFAAVTAAGYGIVDVATRGAHLEDVFLELTGRTLHVEERSLAGVD